MLGNLAGLIRGKMATELCVHHDCDEYVRPSTDNYNEWDYVQPSDDNHNDWDNMNDWEHDDHTHTPNSTTTA